VTPPDLAAEGESSDPTRASDHGRGVTLALRYDEGGVDPADQAPPAPCIERKEHLDREPRPTADVSVTAPREAWCRECGSRVTVAPDGIHEYGHRLACEHRRLPGGDDPRGGGASR
jgi:hypothetical protein